ncbi:CapA family protein [Nocardia australiensis]|uniref:CapA family protein n=1 Tax=Nocardia australiensis TaxID=2887191 RepID=UPI001D159A14|nr:CapA family protein [Nocardia australiensis]
MAGIDNGDVATVLLGGDVMLGRGVDQILPQPGDPMLREQYVHDARTYVELAELAHGPIARPVDFRRPWGDVLPILAQFAPQVRLINLETSITADGWFAPAKGIHYRMNPDNLPVLTAIAPVVCALANNHVLDFGTDGLSDTLDALDIAGIQRAGAGEDLDNACAPALFELDDRRRVVIVSIAVGSSGVPAGWAARRGRPGLWRIGDAPSLRAADGVASEVLAHKRDRDTAIVSIHWGPNWGYGVALSEIQFAHRLIDAGVDLVHGHSAHHPRPIEIYRGKPILYGCGDVIDDYEGIGGHARYRPDLRLLYLISIEPDAMQVRLIPLRIRRMRLESAAHSECQWLCQTIEHISHAFGTRVAPRPDGLPVVFEAVQR